MSWDYSYDPHLWPSLVALALVISLGWYSWSRRNVSGAKPFAITCFFGTLWALAAALETAAEDFSTQVFWLKFQVAMQMPTVTALTCFVLVYAGLGHWLTRRNLILLGIPSLLVLVFVIIDNYTHLIWTGFSMAEDIIPLAGRGNRFFVGYAYILGIVNVLVLLWLAIRSPRYRWPVAIMLSGQIISRGFYLVNNINNELLGPGETVFLVVGIMAASYAFAFFRYHVLDPVTAARTAVLQQMHEGMLVLDLQGRIVDFNLNAAKLLGETAASLRGRVADQVLPENSHILTRLDQKEKRFEIGLGGGKAARYYNLSLKTLTDRSGQAQGHLILLHDITEEKSMQRQVLEDQKAMATLQERERLARELHDGIGQVLGYISLQAQTARKLIQVGDGGKAQSLLTSLAEVARDAHADVRESILSLKAGTLQEWSFLPALGKYLNDFQLNYGIHTELTSPAELKEGMFEAGTEVQLLRVIQEALTNARKHGGAHNVQVSFQELGSRVLIAITDDGKGFDPDNLNSNAGDHFGLGFMRERMEQIGGAVTIDSRPGEGTMVKLEVPIRKRLEENL